MAQAHELRFYEYVNRPYAAVRDALRADLAGILARATQSATDRADALAANLRVELGGIEVGTAVVIEVVEAQEHPRGPLGPVPTTVIKLRWKAARAAAIFPSMEAELSIYPLSKDETQLDLHGVYRPPLGALGTVVDAMVGHRIADASVHRFVSDVATLLKTELA
ncbi:MAG: hypothetical protein U0168_07045 [Nannocystaceae bacterium]